MAGSVTLHPLRSRLFVIGVIIMAYLVLFISAFGAATLLPLSSELTLVAMLSQEYSVIVLWSVATLGNTLGACVNWWLGIYLAHFKDRPWFPFKPVQLEKAQHWFKRYGQWGLLLSWMPVVGDALTLVAGTLRVRFSVFLILVALGKGARYAVVIAVFFKVFSF